MSTQSTSIAKRIRSPDSRRSGKPRKRAEQERSQATRSTILEAALAEFAEKGFAAASIRSIAERTGFQHPLLTYHYRTKDLLWRAVAEDTFARIRDEWDKRAPQEANLSPLERLRAEYRALFRHTVAFPEFHRFMRQEASPDNPRLDWVAETVLKPLIDRLLPQIKAAQTQGLLPRVEPILFHYMMVSLTAALSEFAPEMRVTRRLSADRPEVIEAYWKLVEDTVFGTMANGSAGNNYNSHDTDPATARKRKQRV
ncbi:MAG: TetR/AcrR family transcriptional regulator [Betaproteobacteria bacterium]|nr:MAG: TetR/AcrR family transcriptional regulator [Betaproteobacteria bacterium]